MQSSLRNLSTRSFKARAEDARKFALFCKQVTEVYDRSSSDEEGEGGDPHGDDPETKDSSRWWPCKNFKEEETRSPARKNP